MMPVSTAPARMEPIPVTPTGLTRMTTFLNGLPAGLDSYPNYVQRASVFRAFSTFLPTHGLPELLPAPLATLLAGTYDDDDWLSEAHVTAIYLASADLNVADDREFVAKAFAANQALFNTPVYKLLMGSLPPTCTFMGAAARWGVFHRGIKLTARLEDEPYHGQIRLDFPPGLVPPLISRCYCTAFEATCLAAGAIDAWSTVISQDATHYTFSCTWRE